MRQREEHELSAEARRDLEALDRALAGDPVDPDLDGVATLARELRAARPQAAARFAAELDDRIAAGFSSAAAQPKWNRIRDWLAGLRPMQVVAPAGALATAAIVISVAVIRSDGGDVGPQGDATTAGSREPAVQADAAAERPSPPADGGASGEAQGLQLRGTDDPGARLGPEIAPSVPPTPPVPDPDRLAPGQRDRVVESSAQVALSADGDEFEEVTDGVIEITDRYRGFVVSSDETTSGETSRASFELAIPSDRLQEAIADLSGLAHVESRSEASRDITAATVGARAELTDAQAEVDSLLRQLAEAGTPTETREIRARLEIARAQVAEARDDVRRLARRAQFATVAVAVTSDGSGDGDWGVEEALDDVGGILSTAAGVVLVSLAVLVPLSLVLALVALAYRLAVRRGRERALAGPSE
jgi:hypothetical protein